MVRESWHWPTAVVDRQGLICEATAEAVQLLRAVCKPGRAKLTALDEQVMQRLAEGDGKVGQTTSLRLFRRDKHMGEVFAVVRRLNREQSLLLLLPAEVVDGLGGPVAWKRLLRRGPMQKRSAGSVKLRSRRAENR
jgi:hypothetical protein